MELPVTLTAGNGTDEWATVGGELVRATRNALAGCLAAAAAGSFLLSFAATPAGAAPMWLPPAKLSGAGQSAEAPQVSVDAQGDALAVWQRYDEGSGKTVIESAGRPAGGSGWDSPVVVSSSADDASLPQVALDSHGDAVAVWLSLSGGGEYSIEASTKSGFTGAWQTPVTLRELGPMAAMDPRPDLAVDSQGDAVVVWECLEGGEDLVEGASRPAGGSWQAPETLSTEAENLHAAEVGIDAAGDATAVWEEKGAEVRIDAASKPAGGQWQHPVAISPEGDNANEPRLAVAANGDAVAAWEHFESEELIEATVRNSAGAWGKPVALTQPETGKGEPAGQQVAIDGQGDAVLVWARMNGGQEIVEATERSASSATWQPVAALSGPGESLEELPRVAANGQRHAVVVWERRHGGEETVEAAAGLATSNSWQTPVALSSAGEPASEPQIGIDGQGNAVAVWSRFDGASYIAQAAGYDAVGPELNSLTIPTTGTVGQALAFSTAPFDVWSALGATSWSFGDGTSQAGTSVTHAYGAPGTYTVTVTSADVLGNTSSTSGALQITGPATNTKPPVLAPVAPKIIAAHLTAKRFRVSADATAISAKAKAPRGTSLRFTLSETAKLKVVFERSAAGLRHGKRCVAPSAKLIRAHAKRCTRTLRIGTLTRAAVPAGSDSLSFSGRIGTRPLAPGSYKAVLTASAGGLSSTPVTLSLTVVG
ncbi:MAG TPA: PKD domain-containing protein [Solirubrobacteraceae bacterium]|jgi:hypothetical protein|nr:PKD domain-containing protein [Solirubrobacteraceae bacterium]